MESVVDPPDIPNIKRPPFLGVAALAVPLSNAGDTAAMSPMADTRVMKSRLLMFPWDSKRSSSFSFDMVPSFLTNGYGSLRSLILANKQRPFLKTDQKVYLLN